MQGIVRLLIPVAGSLLLIGCATTEQPYGGQTALSPRQQRMQSIENQLAVVKRRLDALDNVQQSQNVPDQLRQMRGQIQELQHQQQQFQKSVQMTLNQDSQRLQQLEGGAPAATGSGMGSASSNPAPEAASSSTPPAASVGAMSPAQSSSVPAANNAAVSSTDQQAAYIRAFNQLQAGKLDAAISGFKAMLKQYPHGQYASNALYWLGSAYYVKGDSGQALSNLNRILSEFPHSAKVPDALLKIGIIDQDRNKTTKAKAMFNKVISDYPNSNAATLAKQRLGDKAG